MKINTSYQGYIYVADPSTDPPTPVTGLVDGDFSKLVIVNNVYEAAPFLVLEQVDAINAAGVYRWAYLTTVLGVCRLEIGYAPLNFKFVGEYPVTTYDLDDMALEVTLDAHEASQLIHRGVSALQATLQAAMGDDWTSINNLHEIYEIVNALPSAGTGDVSVNHNTGGTDNLRAVDQSGAGIDNMEIAVYLKSDFDAGNQAISYRKAWSTTKLDGRWRRPVNLDSGLDYTVLFFKEGRRQVTKEISL